MDINVVITTQLMHETWRRVRIHDAFAVGHGLIDADRYQARDE
ncbi:hypothetical protein [Sphingobium sp.]|nr:hypothetical protein [Sphingobium sp.]